VGAAVVAAVAAGVLIGRSLGPWLGWWTALLVALLTGWRLRFRASAVARGWRGWPGCSDAAPASWPRSSGTASWCCTT
jgi:hypothetical protein